MHKNEVCARANEDPERSPQLPGHHQPATDRARCNFSAVDWDSDFFQTHADSEEYTAGDKLAPFLYETLSDG